MQTSETKQNLLALSVPNNRQSFYFLFYFKRKCLMQLFIFRCRKDNGRMSKNGVIFW